jgi:pilus assembly protein CpaB
MKWPRSLPLSRLVLIVVAVGAAACAAWLATQYEQPSPAQAVPVATMPIQATAPVTRILVAAQPIPVGQRLTAQSIQWQDWPDTALRPEFITASAEPDALTKMQDSVARVDFVAGDPILAQKLAPAGGGFLSSILDKGKRAVSVTVAAESASGGFVLPNDHVDVVLTRVSDLGQDSHTILSDVRVLAINTRLGNGPAGAQSDASQDPGSQAFADKAIATLELDPTQSEVIINATSLGRLSLVLRPTLDTPPASATADAPSDNERAANAAIRLSSPFWTK